MVEELEPRVVAELGTCWPRPYLLRLGPPSGDWNAETRESDRLVTIAPAMLEPWRVAHELVHVHATGRWEHLPGVVEEGLANVIAARVTGQPVHLHKPAPELLARVLSISYTDYLTLPAFDRLELNDAAAWLATQLLPATTTFSTGAASVQADTGHE